jgi:hypothetical protein
MLSIPIAVSKERRRGGTPLLTNIAIAVAAATINSINIYPIGSLSVNTATIRTLGTDTIHGETDPACDRTALGRLGFDGKAGLDGSLLSLLLPVVPNTIRLSVKNCQRLTGSEPVFLNIVLVAAFTLY